MKIVQMITDRNLRGAQVFACQLADELVLQGHEVMVVSLYQFPGQTVMMSVSHAAMMELKGQKTSISLSLARALAAVLRDFEPDVVQANGSDTLKYAVLAKALARGEYKIVYRNISMIGSWGKEWWKRFIYGRLFSQTDLVISLTQRTKDEFISVFHYPAAQIVSIPIGTVIPPEGKAELNKLRKELNLTDDTSMLLHVGAFSPEKNHEGLLRIFAGVHAQYPASVLILVGDGRLREAMMQHVSTMHLSDAVHFLGHRDDIGEWMGEASVLLLTSHVEGLPGVILEAMAHRVPVVAYGVGAVSEILEDGKQGYVAPPGDEKIFSQRTLTLLRDPSMRRGMGDKGRSRVETEYSLPAVAAAFEQAYRKLLKET